MPSAGHHFLKYNQTHKANNFFPLRKGVYNRKKSQRMFSRQNQQGRLGEAEITQEQNK